MRPIYWSLAVPAVVLGLELPAAGADRPFNAVAAYDSTSNANQVDSNATGNPITSAAGTDVLGFTSSVAAAFAASRGGVIDFDVPLSTILPSDTVRFVYAGGAKSLAVTPSRDMRTASYGSATAISGANQFDLPDAVDNQQSFTLTFGPITGGEPDEFIRAIGFTANSRNNLAPTVSMTVGYSDGSSSAPLSRAMTAGAALDDTFYGFEAPAGLGITSLTVDRTLRVPFDDFGFITAVPEPTSATLLAVGAAGLLIRRRRRGLC
jgi:hypothetical protein